jgi:cell division protein FtsL
MAEFSNRFLRGLNTSGGNTGRGEAGKMVTLVFLIFIPALIYVFFYMQSVTVKYDINSLEKERDSLKSQNKMLEYRLHAALSGSAIEKVAIQRYGFRPANPGDVKVINKELGLFAFLGTEPGENVR